MNVPLLGWAAACESFDTDLNNLSPVSYTSLVLDRVKRPAQIFGGNNHRES
jgi:hypothetical protein